MSQQLDLARLFFRETAKIHTTDEPLPKKTVALYSLLTQLLWEGTRHERIQFTTMFARMAFVCQKFQIAPQKQLYLHTFRKVAERARQQPDSIEQSDYLLGLRVLSDQINILLGEIDIPDEIRKALPKANFYKINSVPIAQKIAYLRVVCVSNDTKNECLRVVTEDRPDKIQLVCYNLPERNENFRKSIELLGTVFPYPISMNLLDIEVDTDGFFRPRGFVIEPDYLVDVTAIAGCFKESSAEPLTYLLKKFLPRINSDSMMIGNIANFFLDELIANPDAGYKETFRKTFRMFPLIFSVYENDVVAKIYQASQKHFAELYKMVNGEFQKHGIEPSDCFLEPSFASERYGIQGRLDVFYKNPLNDKSAIIELKSGKPFKPNTYGLTNEHFIQTLLYDLMVKSAFKERLDPTNYILYSVLDTQNLKFAPPIKSQQFEALNVRNQLIGLEQALINVNDPNRNAGHLLRHMITRLERTATGFDQRNTAIFSKMYHSLDQTEQAYFTAFASFVSREHRIAKTGMQGQDDLRGVASLWLNDLKTKEENFSILSHLKIIDNQSRENDPFLHFERTELTNPLANFRQGDIVVLYPAITEHSTILDNQIFKCTITELTPATATLRLRSRQLNQMIFEGTEYWNVEPDMLDSSFNSMYQSLRDFAVAPKRKRALLLGSIAPDAADAAVEKTLPIPAGVTDEQGEVFQKIVRSKDYFLLWGPPGTGKTSVMLKSLVEHFYYQTEENILLLAYTNRAVDEICEALISIGDDMLNNFVRIGSRFSTAPQFHAQLLDTKIEQIDNRKALRAVIDAHRIYVGTASSVLGRPELFALKHFHRALIDEASQILEPMLVGLLTRFDHFTLIGDHKQLPAIAAQSEAHSATHEKALHDIGLFNLRNSLFERLFRRAKAMETSDAAWKNSFAQLSHQGRMHEEIMAFPNTFFYENNLRILPAAQGQYQTNTLNYVLPDNATVLEQILVKQRLIVLHTDIELHGGGKTNAHEARLISELVHSFERIYAANQRHLHPHSIGVITPYRAQIAQIQEIFAHQQKDIQHLTIDTVERYQGGARDVILISLCANRATQMAQLVSRSEEGVDRKLNVAMTRAREHLIIVGNSEVLKTDANYAELVARYGVHL
jgi:DNA replication ATP-dependent helicase Dna2